MSSTTQSTQYQEKDHGRSCAAPQQAHQPVKQRLSGPQLSQAITTYHVRGLVVNYLERYPGFFAGLLVKHEQWLAHYIREQYNIELPIHKVVLKHPVSSLHTNSLDKRNSTGAIPQRPVYSSAPTSNQMVPRRPVSGVRVNSPATQAGKSSTPCKAAGTPLAFSQVNQPVESQHLPSVESFSFEPISSAIQNSTNYQKPSIENTTSYESTYNHRGDSPKSTSSQPSVWPTEEDLNVPYPAPDNYIKKEAGLNKGKGYKWTFEEQDWAIGYMYEMRDDPKIPRTEKRFDEVSHRLKEEHHIDRSKDSVKNMWNRIGRYRSKYDERKNKSAPLATSQQGKQARLDNEAKKTRKRKASEEPPAKGPKRKRTKTKVVSVDPTLTASGDWTFLGYVQAQALHNSTPRTVHASQIQPLQGDGQSVLSSPAATALPLVELDSSEFDMAGSFPGVDFDEAISDEDLAKIIAYDSAKGLGLDGGAPLRWEAS